MKQLLIVSLLFLSSCLFRQIPKGEMDGRFYISSGNARVNSGAVYKRDENVVIYISNSSIAFYHKESYRNRVFEVEPRSIRGDKRSYRLSCNGNQVITFNERMSLMYVDSVDYETGSVDRYLYFYNIRGVDKSNP